MDFSQLFYHISTPIVNTYLRHRLHAFYPFFARHFVFALGKPCEIKMAEPYKRFLTALPKLGHFSLTEIVIVFLYSSPCSEV